MTGSLRQAAVTTSLRTTFLRGLLAAVLLVGPATSQSVARDQWTVSSRPPMVTAETERAIKRGLRYLARNQERDGHWEGKYPTAMTAFAGLALLAGGNTPHEGRYAGNVRRAADFLLRTAGKRKDGYIITPAEEAQPWGATHGHGLAMLFLAEVYGNGLDDARQRRIRRVLQDAVKFTIKIQSPAGGWYYSPGSRDDEGSVTVTQIQALRACYNAGIDVPKSVIEHACKYIADSANPDGGIRYRARGAGPSRPPITAAAVATMYHAGKYENPIAHKCLKYLEGRLKGGQIYSEGNYKYYTTFYAAQAFYLASEKHWRRYFPGCRDDLVKIQQSDGRWPSTCTYEMSPIYSTSIALVALQLPYAHLPIFQR